MEIYLPYRFDWKNPDYREVFAARIDMLQRIRRDPSTVPKLKAYYKENPAQMIADWGVTFDPRNIDIGLPAVIPFIPFPKQVEFVAWDRDRWQSRSPGLVEKSRDMGMSWLLVAIDCCDAINFQNLAVGYGSRKEEYVDKVGSPKSLFYKARMFLNHLPEEFRGGFDDKKHSPHMRITIPETGSVMTGEAGNNIGRGDRTSKYRVDEAAFLEQPELVDAALSNTTRYRLDLSSVNGMGNPFAQKRHGGKIAVFVFDWRDDPRKDQAWYDKMVNDLDNPLIVAQEIDRNYNASALGVLIPNEWVQAAIDAHVKLGIKPTGRRISGMDVADEGIDKNAFASRHGIVLNYLEEWSGKGSDIMGSVAHAFNICDELGVTDFLYDADGLGAGVRGDARTLNESRKVKIATQPFRGSGAVLWPEKQVTGASGQKNGRTNEDYFYNYKAQSWWALRTRFQKTFRLVTQGIPCDPNEIISLDSGLKWLNKLTQELSQPTYSINGTGKILVDKAPDGVRSPNLADSVMIAYAPTKPVGFNITQEDINSIR